MAGTKAGGLKAAATNKRIFGSDYYASIGAKGGRHTSQSKGFAYRKECHCRLIEGTHPNARCAGKKGGTISKRGKAK